VTLVLLKQSKANNRYHYVQEVKLRTTITNQMAVVKVIVWSSGGGGGSPDEARL